MYGGLVVIALILVVSGTDEEVQEERSLDTGKQHTAPASVSRVLGEMQTAGTSTPREDREPDVIKESATTTEKARYYPVVKVVDGDTLSIEKDGARTTLRLIGVSGGVKMYQNRRVENALIKTGALPQKEVAPRFLIPRSDPSCDSFSLR